MHVRLKVNLFVSLHLFNSLFISSYSLPCTLTLSFHLSLSDLKRLLIISGTLDYEPLHSLLLSSMVSVGPSPALSLLSSLLLFCSSSRSLLFPSLHPAARSLADDAAVPGRLVPDGVRVINLPIPPSFSTPPPLWLSPLLVRSCAGAEVVLTTAFRCFSLVCCRPTEGRGSAAMTLLFTGAGGCRETTGSHVVSCPRRYLIQSLPSEAPLAFLL